MRSTMGTVLAAGVLMAACGGSGSSPTSTTTSTTTSSAGGGGSGGGGTGGEGGGLDPGGCTPACVAPQFCSVDKTCIDEGTCHGDGDCNEGTVCDLVTKTCVPGGGCGAQEAVATAIPPNLIIALDRSCSMTAVVSMNKTKWDIAVAALGKLTTDYASKIRFGLALFPDTVGNNCTQGDIPIPTAPGNEAAIQTLLTSALVKADPNFPDGPCVTNIDTGVQQAAADPALNDPERKSFVLLITDGKQAGCNTGGGDMGTLATITELQQMRGIGTFVVGFGSGVDVAQMNQFAVAGGVPNPDPVNDFYDASDQASLDAALTVIASQTISCNFALDKAPPDPAKVFVFFDNDPGGVPKDPTHADGWDYDPMTNQVTFYGPTCEALKAGTITDVDIVFGCDEPTPD
jgi:hypothetical protein